MLALYRCLDVLALSYICLYLEMHPFIITCLNVKISLVFSFCSSISMFSYIVPDSLCVTCCITKHIIYIYIYIHSTISSTSYRIANVASTKDTTLIGRISDVVRPEREPDFVA